MQPDVTAAVDLTSLESSESFRSQLSRYRRDELPTQLAKSLMGMVCWIVTKTAVGYRQPMF
jgi:hypothetical protein